MKMNHVYAVNVVNMYEIHEFQTKHGMILLIERNIKLIDVHID